MTVFSRIISVVGLLKTLLPIAHADTVISGHLFQASLPGRWSQVSARPDLYIYRCVTHHAEITFSSLFSKELMPIVQQRETLRLVADKHRAAQLQVGPTMVLSETSLSASQLSARINGSDASSGLRATSMLLSGPRGVVITYLEMFDTDQSTFESQAAKILASVRLRAEPPNKSLKRTRAR
jgi:hypothetical protein